VMIIYWLCTSDPFAFFIFDKLKGAGKVVCASSLYSFLLFTKRSGRYVSTLPFH
jgi:hypothetical protein